MALVDVTELFEWRRDQIEVACASYWEEGWIAWHIENVRPVSHGGWVLAARKLYEVEANLEFLK